MKKKFGLLAIMSLSIMLLSACSSTTTLEEDNNAVVAQYIAGSVLKFDKNYTGGLVYAYQRAAAEETTANDTLPTNNTDNTKVEDTKVEETKVENTTKTEGSDKTEVVKETYCELSEIYQNKNLAVSYKKFLVQASYSGEYSDVVFNVGAEPEKQLVILEFKIKNNGKKDQKINLIRSGISYKLEIGKEEYYPMLSIASNDIQFFSSTIGAGKTENAVLIFKVPKSVKVSSGTLTVTNIDKVSQVTIK
ncbi:DUF4352 domain-containing protein [Anaerosporobacter sp.]|uniref:DUF4352 domain-containing protein n=1 Tax=Anaerosporobacter sp. TaxID=1872529 RepID=UPI00286ED43B|nr:DUF4352 domain-containing protein [Anaerosporobacter sp.]